MNELPSMRSGGTRVIAVVLMGLIAWLAAFGLRSRERTSPSEFEQAMPATGAYVLRPSSDGNPLYTPTDAMAKAQSLLPAEFVVSSGAARKISGRTLDGWRGVSDFGLGRTTPVWLVAMMGRMPGRPATVSDIAIGDADADPRPIEGIFFAFDANEGHLVGSGGLGDAWLQNWATFSDLAEENVAVVAPTAAPTKDLRTADWETQDGDERRDCGELASFPFNHIQLAQRMSMIRVLGVTASDIRFSGGASDTNRSYFIALETTSGVEAFFSINRMPRNQNIIYPGGDMITWLQDDALDNSWVMEEFRACFAQRAEATAQALSTTGVTSQERPFDANARRFGIQ